MLAIDIFQNSYYFHRYLEEKQTLPEYCSKSKKPKKSRGERETKQEKSSLVYFGGLCICAHISHLQSSLEIHTFGVKPLIYYHIFWNHSNSSMLYQESWTPHSTVMCWKAVHKQPKNMHIFWGSYFKSSTASATLLFLDNYFPEE